MRPVDETAEIVPLVHTAHVHSIAHAQRDAFREIDVVCNQQRLAVADIDNEPLVPRAIVIIGQQASHEAGHFDPLTVIAFCERLVQWLKKAR